MIGAERLRRSIRVPIANAWVCASLDAKGLSVAEIARPARLADVSVQRLLKTAGQRMAEGKAT